MKRIVILLLLLVTATFAQNNTSSSIFSLEGLRITGGMTYSSLLGPDVEDYDELKWVSGISFGLEKTLPIGIITGLTFTKRGWEERDSGDDWEYKFVAKLNYFTIYGVYPFNLGSISVFVGGEVGFFNKMKMKEVDKDDYYGTRTNKETINRDEWGDNDGALTDFGVLAGINYDINNQFGVQGSYYFGLVNLNEDLDIRNGTIKLVFIFKPNLTNK